MRNAENAAIGTAAAQIPTLSTEDLNVGYGKTAVVNGIRIRVETGEILCLIGPNGAGKSTILKTLIRQLAPMEGAVLLEGTALTALKERELARKSFSGPDNLRRACRHGAISLYRDAGDPFGGGPGKSG